MIIQEKRAFVNSGPGKERPRCLRAASAGLRVSSAASVLPLLTDSGEVCIMELYYCSANKQKFAGIGIGCLKARWKKGSGSCTFENQRLV